MFLASVHQEVQPVKVLLQVGQQENLRFVIGAVHIVDFKGLEITDHNPAGLLRIRQETTIAPSLLERREHRPIRLTLTLLQVDLHSLLLDQRPGSGNISVNIFCGGRAVIVHDFYSFFKFDGFRGLFSTIDVLEKCNPKPLCLLLFIAPVLPVCHEFIGGTPPFSIGHYSALPLCLLN